MSRLYLVRHGEAAAGWGEDPDPGLSDRGRAQAEAMAADLAPLGPLDLVTSPLRRARETAAALEAVWGVTARVEPAVGEVPSPTDDLGERMAWLRDLFATPWDDWPPAVQAWRAAIRPALAALPHDTVVCTHFVLVQQVVGDPAWMPDNCSVTVVDAGPDGLRVVERGRSRATTVL